MTARTARGRTSRRSRTRRARRRAVTVTEVLIALGVLAAATAAVAPAARRAAEVNRAAADRRAAAAELSNVLAGLAALPPSALRAEAAAGTLTPPVRPAVARRLPGAALTVTPAEPVADANLVTLRLDGVLSWPGRGDGATRRVELSAWSVGVRDGGVGE